MDNRDDNIDIKLFEFDERKDRVIEDIQGSSLSFWTDARVRFSKNKAAVFATIALIILLVIAITSPFLGAYYNDSLGGTGEPGANIMGQFVNADLAKLPPKIPVVQHIGIADGVVDGVDKYAEAGIENDTYFLFGTDGIGRDLFVRTMIGSLVSIGFGLAAAVLDILIGVSLGGISGYYGGKIDLILQRIVEVLGSIPRLIWVILLIMYLNPGVVPLLLAMMISGWIPMYRIVRGQVFKLKEQEFVLSSKTLGGGGLWIIFKHILPNTMGVIIIWLMFTIPSAIFFESFLSFLGLGISVPTPSLGSLANDGREYLNTFPYILFIPASVLSIIMLAFNLIADGLRDAFDPKMRGGE